MKKVLSLLLAMAMCCSLAACGSSTETTPSTTVHTCSGEWVVLDEATCQQVGSRQRTCSCGKTESESIPKLSHTYADGACTICGAKDPDFVPAGSVGLTFETKSDGTCRVTGIGTCTDKDIVIPATDENGARVTEIGYDAFTRTDITSVVIPEGVTHIGTWAFAKCENLQSVTIPTTVETIGSAAFLWCYKLTEVYIRDLVAWCNIDFCDGDYGTGQPMIYGLASLYVNGDLLTDLVIPEGVTTLRRSVFLGCGSITSVTIPESVTTMEDGAFASCINLKHITIPKNVNTFGEYVFSTCTSLVSVTFTSETMPTFASYPFWECDALQAVYVADALASEYAKLPDWNLIADKIMLESTGAPIGPSDFSVGLEFTSNGNGTCTLTGIGTCNDTVIKIPETSPAGDTVTAIGDMAFYRAFQTYHHITAVVIPDTVTRIGDNAFRDCVNMAEITFGNSVQHLGRHVFEGCSSLQSLDLPATVTSGYADMLEDCNSLTVLTLRSTKLMSWPLDVVIRPDGAVFERVTAIYVPAELLAEYQADSVWSLFGDRIQAIVEDKES